MTLEVGGRGWSVRYVIGALRKILVPKAGGLRGARVESENADQGAPGDAQGTASPAGAEEHLSIRAGRLGPGTPCVRD